MFSTNTMATENFKVQIDAQIIILKLRGKNWQFLCLLYDLNDHLLVELDPVISLASMLHGQNYHKLHHMDEKVLKPFIKFESKSGLEIKYLICKWTLGWDI